MVLHLVDRNQKWAAFWAALGSVAIIGVLIAMSAGGYLWYVDRHNAAVFACAQKVRAAYPGQYDALDNKTLGEKVLAKYETCSFPPH